MCVHESAWVSLDPSDVNFITEMHQLCTSPGSRFRRRTDSAVMTFVRRSLLHVVSLAIVKHSRVILPSIVQKDPGPNFHFKVM